MNDDNGTDVFIFGDKDDYITISDEYDMTEDDTITLTDWDSPLSTALSTTYPYSASPATISVSGTATTGATLSTTLNNGLMWNNSTTYGATASPYVNATTGAWTTYQQPNVLKVSGDAEFEGDIKVKGVNLTERLDAIEERLGILRPNNDLEGKWEKLKKLGEEYRKLEKEILEGEQIWDMLKK